MDTSIQHEPLSILLKTTTDMDTLKKMSTIHRLPHTATTIMVQHSAGDMTLK